MQLIYNVDVSLIGRRDKRIETQNQDGPRKEIASTGRGVQWCFRRHFVGFKK